MNNNGEPAGRGSRIQSIERASQILSYFRVRTPHLTLQELTARSGLTRATAHRYVSVLRELGFLRFEPTSNSYSLGPAFLMLAAAAAAGQPITRIAGPYMEALSQRTNETVVLAVWDGSHPVVLRVNDNTDRVVRVSVKTGARLPAWASAHGRLFCAFLPEDGLPPIPARLRRKDLHASLESIRRGRLSINTNEVEGTRTLAAPIFSDSELVATLAVVGTSASIAPEDDSPLAVELRTAASRLSSELGGVQSPSHGAETPR